jgi:hypothetical protein
MALLIPLRAVAAPLEEVRTPHFVFLPDSGSAGLARSLSERAEDARQALLHRLGVADDRVIEVRIASDEDQMSLAVGTDRPVGEWIAGMAWPREGRMVISARGNEVFSARDTFLHELAHLYLETAVGGRRVPRWFHEGFAMQMAGEPLAMRLKAFLEAGATGSYLPLEDLDDGFPDRPPAVHLAYAQSRMFVQWLDRRSGGRGIARLVEAMRSGMDFPLAFDLTWGASPSSLFDVFRKTASPLASWLYVLTGSAVLWFLIAGLFLWAYLRKRRRAQQKRRLWELQEEFRGLASSGDSGEPETWTGRGPTDIQ